MNVPTRTLAITALIALIPLTGLIIWSAQSDPPDTTASTEPPAPVQSQPVPQPIVLEPLARELPGTPAETDDSADITNNGDDQKESFAAVSAQLNEALALLNSQSDLLKSQTDKLDAQSTTLQSQAERMQRLESAFDDLQGKMTLAATGIDVIGNQQAATSGETIDVTGASADPEESTSEPAITSAAVAEETTASQRESKDEAEVSQQDDPTRVIMNSLPGAMRLPGTDTVMKWGGFVKSTLVNSFDPLASTDRFITGAIPVEPLPGVEEETSITVSQSRLSLDMREPTNVGLLRAFVEGDFAGNGETFRLRHAFGQRGNVLAGKTWSGFVDRSASPEEVDFEGLNGRINVRQAQMRFQPGFGRKYEMAVSIEDPDPEVTGGDGVSQVPDVVISGRVNINNNVYSRLALLLRQVRAQPDSNPDDVVKEYGYALQWSGRIDAPWFDQRDSLMFQINAGKGYGRYVNDLNSVGDFDGIFSPDGDLELIDVLSGYVSAQHWWRGSLRSNLTFGYVQLDNPDFVDDDFYKSTMRVSANLFWSPTPRFDLGGELLWGMRENENGEDGTASQFQFAAKYLF
jgi:hypothetical protein